MTLIPAVVQFGFVATFGAACPLALLFALLSDWVEIHLDARLFIRPVAECALGMGIWFRMQEASRAWRASAGRAGRPGRAAPRSLAGGLGVPAGLLSLLPAARPLPVEPGQRPAAASPASRWRHPARLQRCEQPPVQVRSPGAGLPLEGRGGIERGGAAPGGAGRRRGSCGRGGAGRHPKGPGWEGLAPLSPASRAAMPEGISRGRDGALGARGLSPAAGSGWQAEKGVGTSACPPPPLGSRRYQASWEDDGHHSRTYWTLGPSVRPSSRCSRRRGPQDAGPRSHPRAPPKVSAWSSEWAWRRPRGRRPCSTPAGRRWPSASSPPGLASVQGALGTAGSVEAGVVCLAASAFSGVSFPALMLAVRLSPRLRSPCPPLAPLWHLCQGVRVRGPPQQLCSHPTRGVLQVAPRPRGN